MGLGVVVVRLERVRRQWRRTRDALRTLTAELGPEEGLEVWHGRPRRVPADLSALFGEYGCMGKPQASARQLLLEAARLHA
ncbi:hypothetical protein C9F11_47120 (plasmid) [Streptomyces sp. YIM 121038]|uniref:hypothetical protein n=1 Tax=Streptomyces sp. YIM 121038 TaxID=2136401 RepID=UPI0011100536|nr:hypothetical protein [Streptomyces sp. YIM 121038]QCX73715.1 hypothetical protein C9F11_00060 [Streptomyces sp. YIM 121038]QCX82104.1 hypothetical protein C9F11_42620 [Streptomyces sp. YIM 121038]QCX82127.1 hypothetical protein C9F11_42735 [Streptomyces sp. YIM 121038]QCX82971.1 hypothetical protein C9F11_47120 [Streptomyces sp. YIM 121038]